MPSYDSLDKDLTILFEIEDNIKVPWQQVIPYGGKFWRR